MNRCSSPRATSATWWTRWSGGGSISRRQEGRTNRLYLTEEGRRLFEEVVPAHEDLVHQLMSALPEEEQAQLHELLRGLDHSL